MVESQRPDLAAGVSHELIENASVFVGSDASIQTLSAQQLDHLAGLLYSPHRQQRIAALEFMKRIAPTDVLRAHVKAISEQNDDAIVQGYARLLAADWGISARQPSATTGPDQTNRNPRKSSGSFTNQPKLDVLDSQVVNLDSIPEVITGETAEPGLNFAKPTFLTPQVPFWASNSSIEDRNATDPEVDQGLLIEAVGFEPHFGEDTAGKRFSQINGSPMTDEINPTILSRSIDEPDDPPIEFEDFHISPAGFQSYERESPLGFTGPSGVMPTGFQQSDHFVPIEDRWRLGFPKWDRYGKGHPVGDDYPYVEGSLWDPYNQNVLKGDFPIIGQHTFFSVTAESLAVHEYRQTPTATTPFESTRNPFSAKFFGVPDQYFYAPYFKFTFDLFHGNEAFKPVDWKLRLMPVFNVNNLDVKELAVVNPDVRQGTNRLRDDFALQEWFLEAKLADFGPDYDFVSARVGSQSFNSDFRGFVFRDVNRAVRLFGTRLANRDQFNAIWFDQAEKDTNSELNTFDDRHQNVIILNYFRQDFVFPGYTAQTSFHYNHDKPSFQFDDNDNLVRPDPVGVFKEHEVNAYYIGVGGEGHLGRINVANQFYVALGNDSANPIGGTEQTINAQMAALELSYDRDWIRFRTSYFFASGDDDPNDGKAKGFDTILDNPVFAGGEFSYWQRQSIRLFGTNLVQRKSLVPNLRSNKAQGQSNFVNPGLHLFNLGMDLELTPKTRVITNANYLSFDETRVLETYTFQNKINHEIGTDLSAGLEYRPRLNDNAIIVMGIATLLPDQGLKDLFGTRLPQELADLGVGNELRSETPQFTTAFVELVLTY